MLTQRVIKELGKMKSTKINYFYSLSMIAVALFLVGCISGNRNVGRNTRGQNVQGLNQSAVGPRTDRGTHGLVLLRANGKSQSPADYNNINSNGGQGLYGGSRGGTGPQGANGNSGYGGNRVPPGQQQQQPLQQIGTDPRTGRPT